MDILSINFEEKLGFILDSIENSDFISIDTEFTGLFNREEDVFDVSDTLEERYRKLKTSCDQYFMCQLGLCTFQYDNSSSIYIARPFNIYILPNSVNHPMNISPSSMKFLVENEFDFNKLFKYGLNCSRIAEASTVPNSTKKSCSMLGKQSYEKVMGLVSTILAFIDNSNTSQISLEVNDNYTKKLINGPSGAMKYFKNINIQFEEEEEGDDTKEIAIISKIKGKDPIFSPLKRQDSVGDSYEVFQDLGVSMIFAAILKKKAPLVFHNGLFDLGYLFTHFIDSLPHDLDEFKSDVTNIFPKIYDTKLIAKNLEGVVIRRLGLEGLYRTCLSKECFKGLVDFSLDNEFQEYIDRNKVHEAGYDAYITGVCFLHLREYLRSQNPNTKNSLESLKYCLTLNKNHNRLLNLTKLSDNTKRGENIIKFKLDVDMKFNIIAEFLSNFGDVHIRKIANNEYIAKYDLFYNGKNYSDIIEAIKQSKNFNVL